MSKSRTSPYDFADLKAPAAKAPARPVEPSFTVADIERTRANAFAEGLAAARRQAEEEDRAALYAVGNVISALQSEFGERLAAECAELKAAAGDFCRAFAEKLASEREVDAAISLLDRLLAASLDRTPVAISLNDESAKRWKPALEGAIKERDAEKFVSIEGDPNLQRGECRLSWRGGSMSRLLAPSLRKIDAIIAPKTNAAGVEE
jgi:flagellar assembly protein FliH